MTGFTVSEFCQRHHACSEGEAWGVANCKTMQDVWSTAKPEWLIWVATREGVLDDRMLRRFACWSVRQVWQLLTDERSRNAVEVAERYVDGKASDEELAAARSAARSAESAAWSAESAAWSAESAARSAARSAQAQWLRENTTPSFAKEPQR